VRIDIEAAYQRIMQRWPKLMARLAEYDGPTLDELRALAVEADRQRSGIRLDQMLLDELRAFLHARRG
jgi:hypothetical protein